MERTHRCHRELPSDSSDTEDASWRKLEDGNCGEGRRRISLKYGITKKQTYSIQEGGFTEQKLQLHILAKKDHMKQLGECEKCLENVTQQIVMVNEVREELEQNAQAATQNIKKLKAEIVQKNEDIAHLKEELQKLSSDFMNYKVAYEERANKEKIGLLEKEQQIKELKERLQTEKEITKKLLEVNHTLKEEKQKDVKFLSNVVLFLQRHTETISSLEKQLSALKEENKTLERDNELQRASTTENEEKFLALQSEHEKALQMWKQRVEEQQQEMNIIYKEDDKEPTSCEKSNQTKPVDAVNLNQYSSGIDMFSVQNTEENESEFKDRSSHPNVYNRIDKTHLCKEQKSDSNVKENKAKFAASQSDLKECCDGEPTEQIPADRADLQDPDEDGESAAKCSHTLKTQAIMESVMLLRDNNKPLDVCSQDANQQTDCSHRKSGDGTSEVVYIVTDKTDTTESRQGVLINETHVKESQVFPKTTEPLLNRDLADRKDSEYGESTGCITGDGNSYSSGLNCGTSEESMASDINNENKHFAIEPMQAKESNARFCVGSSLCKITDTNTQNIFAENASKNCADINITTAEKESSVSQEQISCSVPSIALNSCDEPVINKHQPSSDYKLDYQGSQPNLEKTDVSVVKNLLEGYREMCTLVREEDEKLGGSNTSYLPTNKGLAADGHSVNICEITEQTGEPLSVKKDSIEENNVPANVTLKESSALTVHESSTEKGNTNPHSERITNMFDSSAKGLCLSRTNSWISKSSNKSFGKLGSPIKRLAFDNLSKNIHPVPRKDRSAEWNAIAQTFHNSPFPTEDVTEKQICCSNNLAAATSMGLNFTQTKAPHDSGQSKGKRSSRPSIQHQITAIEKFLQYQKLHRTKKRKLEDCDETKESTENTDL
ncbi:coiled-coil domain-containing protein 73 [Pyxicephalus adspersus]|uniref:coiled-coil domain-containing protein 73 n=1 Tax=Pyxicephalus adspersus TaxID=30357 RepID=UPI003B5AA000